MRNWTLQHRVRWLVDNVRRGGAPELKRRVQRFVSPAARAARRKYRVDGVDFDAANGYRTNEIVALDDLTIAGDLEGSKHYEGAASFDVVAALAMLDLPIAEATFIDLGCGMGRPLLIAAERPFKRLIGVDFARELLDIAAQNFARRSARHGPDDRVELICSDAAHFPIPDGPVVFFMFNSFGPPILDRLLDNIHASWREHPRPVRFIYLNIQHLDVVLAAGFRGRAVAPDYHFTIFEPV